MRTGALATGELAAGTRGGGVVGAVRTFGETVRDDVEETVRVSTVLSGRVITVDDAIAEVVVVLSDTAGFSVVQAARRRAVVKHSKLAFFNLTPFQAMQSGAPVPVHLTLHAQSGYQVLPTPDRNLQY